MNRRPTMLTADQRLRSRCKALPAAGFRHRSGKRHTNNCPTEGKTKRTIKKTKTKSAYDRERKTTEGKDKDKERLRLNEERER
jgi:hypothetical protein